MTFCKGFIRITNKNKLFFVVAKGNFRKLLTSRVDSRGTPYDYGSLMHYGSRFFSNNGEYTIKTKNPSDQNKLGQRRGFSEIDKEQINLMYCEGKGEWS